MADSTVSSLAAASVLTGAELFYGVQGAADRKVTATQLRTFASGTVYNVQDYGWLPDGTNRSTQALALLTVVVAAGGGTLFFPASATYYRADSQLFIPNDGLSTPNQVNIRFTGAGGGPIWGNVARDRVGAAVLDLRYSAADGNAKIESRGAGGLQIDNLTLLDLSSNNNTPFIHTTNTTLYVHDCTFVGSPGNTGQDTVVMGGPSSFTPSGLVGAPFQGYGTTIQNNMFLKCGGVLGLTWSNQVNVLNNYWLEVKSSRCIEFTTSTGNPPDIITGLLVYGNFLEMQFPVVHGIRLSGVRESLFYNSFVDANAPVNANYVSDYRLIKPSAGGTWDNTFIRGGVNWNTDVFLTQTGDSTQLTRSTVIGSQYNVRNLLNDGIASNIFGSGAEVAGTWTVANSAAGAFNIRDMFNPSEVMCFAAASDKRYIDCWGGSFSRDLTLQPRGGPVTVTSALALRPTTKALVNGLNSNIDLWVDYSSNTKSSWLRLTGPTGAFSLGGFFNSAGSGAWPGSMLTVYNTVAQAMTIVNEDASSTAANRIKTLTGANVVLRTGTSAATFLYDNTELRWILVGQN